MPAVRTSLFPPRAAAASAACFLPRLRRFRYGNPSCAADDATPHSPTSSTIPSSTCCGSQAVFIRTDASWDSWRARRALMHARHDTTLPASGRMVTDYCPYLGGAHHSPTRGGDHVMREATITAVDAGGGAGSGSSLWQGWHFAEALVPIRRQHRLLEAALVRRPPQHGGASARAAFEAQLREVRAVLDESDGLKARVASCLDVVPPRRAGGKSSVAPAAAKPLKQAVVGGDGARVPLLTGWPRHPASE